jgi:hypothetical protein
MRGILVHRAPGSAPDTPEDVVVIRDLTALPALL